MSFATMLQRGFLLVPVVLIFLALAACPGPPGSNEESEITWDIEAVCDGAGGSMALDGSGHPHISYSDGDLKYIRWTGSAWDGLDASAGPDTVDTEYGGYNSMALDDDGHPHICYQKDGGSGGLRYVGWSGSAWDGLDTSAGPDDVDTDLWVGSHTSIAVDHDGYPHISYYDNPNAKLKYIHWNGSSWDGLDGAAGPDFVDIAGAVGKYTSIAVDTGGHPHIAYYSMYLDSLKHARWTGSAWDGMDGTAGTDAVDTTVYGYPYTSLALDGNDYPHISYYDSTDTALKYIRWTGSAWDGLDASAGPDVVDTAGVVGKDTSIAIDNADRPHISYYDETNAALKYARWTGSAWDGLDKITGPDTVDSAGLVGRYGTIALDDNGHLHLSYTDHTNSCLKYARYGK